MSLRRPDLIACMWLGFALVADAAPPEPLRWRRYEEPAFPPQLLPTLVRDGFVTVVFTFDADGYITDRIALAASHPAFVVSVYEAAGAWQVDTRELARFIRRETVRFEFERQRAVIVLTHRDAAKSAFTAYGDQAATALRSLREGQLRAPLAPLATAMPPYPAALAADRARGVATVSFVVDAEGRVRVPAITDATEPEFGEAALGAIRQWRFAPPRQDELPVQVIAERTFRFGPPAEKK